VNSSPHSRQRNARGQGGRLREEIVRAALRLIDAGGAEAVTLRAVAREAGISAPSIYDHFDDLEQILGAVVGQCFVDLTTEIRAAGDGVTDPVQRLEAGCRAYLGYGARHPQRYELLFSRERPSDAAMGEAAASSAAAFATLQDSISDCAAHGRSASTDPFADAVALWSGLHGYARLHTTHSAFPWPPSDDTIHRLIHGLGRITEAP
jgi:AcrR family transcriptional regulator